MSNPGSRPSFGRRLRTPAAAEYIGIAASTLEKMRVFGTGPEFERVGKKAIVYSIEALEAYLAQRRARSTSEADTPAPRPRRRERNDPDPSDRPSSTAPAPGAHGKGGA
jgi:hypothetical protein